MHTDLLIEVEFYVISHRLPYDTVETIVSGERQRKQTIEENRIVKNREDNISCFGNVIKTILVYSVRGGSSLR